MNKILAYIRASSDKQDVKNQRYEILEYGRREQIHIDEFIEITISSRQNSRQRRIEELKEKLETGDTLIVTELSRLGRSTGEVILLITSLNHSFFTYRTSDNYPILIVHKTQGELLMLKPKGRVIRIDPILRNTSSPCIFWNRY